METIDRINNVRNAWGVAWTKGYFQQSIIDYTAPDFLNFILMLLPGLLAALLIPIAGQVGGTAAGTALGAAITAVTGQAEVIPILANLGRVIGALVADAALIYLGLTFIKDYIFPRIGAVGEHIGKGCWLAYNAPPNAGDRLLDEAAHEMAEGIGFFLGLVLMGIVMYLAKGPTQRLAKLNESFLGRTCPKVMDWVVNNLSWLTDRYKAGPTKIAGGGRPVVAVPELPVEEVLQRVFGSTKNVGTLPRQNVRTILEFFQKNNVANNDPAQWAELIRGIDLHAKEPVRVTRFNAGDLVGEYVEASRPAGRQVGQWMVRAQGAVSDRNIGLSGAGRVWKVFRVRQPVEVLESKAAPAADHWTGGGTKPHTAVTVEKGQRVFKPAEQVAGGGMQYFLPKAWEFLEEVAAPGGR